MIEMHRYRPIIGRFTENRYRPISTLVSADCRLHSFTALLGMQTRYSDEKAVRLSVCLSVRLFVRPSVGQTHAL